MTKSSKIYPSQIVRIEHWLSRHPRAMRTKRLRKKLFSNPLRYISPLSLSEILYWTYPIELMEEAMGSVTPLLQQVAEDDSWKGSYVAMPFIG